MKTINMRLVLNTLLILLTGIFLPPIVCGQNYLPSDTVDSPLIKEVPSQKSKSFKMTTLTFGGNGINFTKVNNQFTVMTGGRGSATFNGRYTIGGGGWGMTNGVGVENVTEDIYNFVKMGYGGIDFGYLIVAGDKFNLGTKLLIAGGAVFKETVPESEDKDFNIFPVLEPTIYFQISLNKLFRFEMGARYRLIQGTNMPYISDRELSGFSCYIGFLVSACNCKKND
jgi:hypothetical protein